MTKSSIEYLFCTLIYLVYCLFTPALTNRPHEGRLPHYRLSL